MRHRPFVAVIYLFFCLCCWQVFWWRHQAVHITWFQIKNSMNLLSAQERLEWGMLCNHLKDYACAAEVFSGISLRHQAIAEARLQNCTTALNLFDDYRARGGIEQAESLYWRGVCLLRLKRFDEARSQFYQATALSPEATEAPEALLDLLFQQGLRVEALSVIAALSEGRPSRSERWRKKFSDLTLRQKIKDVEVGVNPTAGQRSLRVPSLDGKIFWIPVKFSAATTPEFVTLDLEQPSVTLNLEQMRGPASLEDPQGVLEALQIGPWMIRDVSYETCRNCTSVLGRTLLDQFEVSEDRDMGLRFLILTPK